MALLQLVLLGHPVLREKAEMVSGKEMRKPGFEVFCRDMIESCRYHGGVGLAAPQVAVPWRVIVLDVPRREGEPASPFPDPVVLVNPELTPLGPGKVSAMEGCLSLKDLRGLVPRYSRVHLTALRPDGRKVEVDLEGLAARIAQHEVDHLDGVVFLDRMPDMTSLVFLDEIERCRNLSPPEEAEEDAAEEAAP